MSSLDEQIRRYVYDLVEQRVSLDDFELWFVGEAFEHDSDLIDRITVVLTDKPADLSDADVARLLEHEVATVRSGDLAVHTGASALTVEFDSDARQLVTHR